MTLSQAYARRVTALKYLQYCSRPYGSKELAEVQKERVEAARKAYAKADAQYTRIRNLEMSS